MTESKEIIFGARRTCSSRFTPGKRDPYTEWIKASASSKPGLNFVGK